MSKVFRHFEKSTNMQITAIVSVILIVITITIFGIIFTVNPSSDYAEVENTLDKEISPNEETTPEIQEKYDDIENTKENLDYIPAERMWHSSGPFQLDRYEYAIGEKMFLRIGGLEIGEKGEIVVMRPINSTHHIIYQKIPFDESTKSAFNYYFEPQISKTRGICSIEDLQGEWFLIFRGTEYDNLSFEVSDRRGVVGGTSIETVC